MEHTHEAPQRKASDQEAQEVLQRPVTSGSSPPPPAHVPGSPHSILLDWIILAIFIIIAQTVTFSRLIPLHLTFMIVCVPFDF